MNKRQRKKMMKKLYDRALPLMENAKKAFWDEGQGAVLIQWLKDAAPKGPKGAK